MSLRAEAGELVGVRLMVNGTAVTVRVEPRVTLADALREQLGLTGTHLGCEHGVCGMCTVLVDGAAARACLLFAVQCEGAEVVTVEGLGTPGDQHPLQRAFAHHHALQCGFCTPGFLMSAYDLLAHRPGVPAADLPGQLSGVLCRCTGYRNIVSAVADVAAAYPDGVPAPGNCRERVVAGRHAMANAAATAGTAAGEPVIADAGIPAGTPTARVQVVSELASPLPRVWAVLEDVERLAPCLPGAELTEVAGKDRYRGRARVSLGPVKLSFAGLARVVERDAGAHLLRVVGQGTDAGGSGTQADIRLRAEASGDGTTLRADADLFLTGRIAQFGRALAGDVSRRMFEQFAASVDETARTGAAPQRPARGASGVRLVLPALAAAARGVIRQVRRHRSRRRGD